MARNKTASPATTKAADADKIRLDLAELVARYGERFTAYQKPVRFDFEQYAATAFCLLLDTPEGTRSANLVTYNGMLSERQASHLVLEDAKLSEDRARLEAGLIKRGYTLATPAAPAPRKVRRRKAD